MGATANSLLHAEAQRLEFGVSAHQVHRHLLFGCRGLPAPVIGAASGPVPPIDVNVLNVGGSLYLTRPTVMHHIGTAAELNRRAAEVFGWIASGKLRVDIGARFAIADVGEAFTALESRGTTGKVVLRH